MNKARRKQIEDAAKRTVELAEHVTAASIILEEIKEELEAARDDEQRYYDDLPENFQSGEKGEAAENAISALEEVIGDLEEKIEALNDLAGYELDVSRAIE